MTFAEAIEHECINERHRRKTHVTYISAKKRQSLQLGFSATAELFV